MEITKGSAAIIVALCLGGGAGGAYLASRGGNTASTAQAPAALASQDAGQAVEQSEAVVSEPVSTPTPTANSTVAPSAPVRATAPRAVPPSRAQAPRPAPASPKQEVALPVDRAEPRLSPPSLEAAVKPAEPEVR